VRRTSKYTCQDYKTYEDILSELKINPVVKKIQNYGYRWLQHVRRMDRETTTLNYEISTMRVTKPTTTSQKLLYC
jgi:hypothetical protein